MFKSGLKMLGGNKSLLGLSLDCRELAILPTAMTANQSAIQCLNLESIPAGQNLFSPAAAHPRRCSRLFSWHSTLPGAPANRDLRPVLQVRVFSASFLCSTHAEKLPKNQSKT